jgi:selenoprotein W-related protein
MRTLKFLKLSVDESKNLSMRKISFKKRLCCIREVSNDCRDVTKDYTNPTGRMVRVVGVVLVVATVALWANLCEAFTISTPPTRCLDAVNSSTRKLAYHGRGKTKARQQVSLLRDSNSPSQTTAEGGGTPNACYQVSIEYCTGCRWGLRAFWMAQELLTTFADDSAMQAVTLIPSKEAGRFLVQIVCQHGSSDADGDDDDTLQHSIIWDRTINVGFPEMKELKQLVRDQIDPDRFLGHGDSEKRKQKAETELTTKDPLNDASRWKKESSVDEMPIALGAESPNLSILYCTGCRWMLRAAYLAQELLSTFDEDISSITLIPSRPPAAGGSFVVRLDDNTVLWDRAERGRFPETKELKQLVRNQLNPSKDLGHSDNKTASEDVDVISLDVTGIDDDEAERARKFFGVA